ncbi:DUF6891 domain-containing protein [uncultured Tessaracoccus sp.]|uniref:DUF6891 domain-containing protein n=1 Tax=uncultured Tessaracoccus sp. TaxID=905023 RepID=UPI0025D74C9E|nr:hypothetical protein [uncultured Tessaracoccus sp.]
MTNVNPADLVSDPELSTLVEAVRADVLACSEPPEEIAYPLFEDPETYPDPDTWIDQLDSIEDDDERLTYVERFVRAVWNDTARRTRAWDGETTDVDRLGAAFDELRAQGIVVEEFTEWAEMDDDEDDLGAVITHFQMVEDLHLGPVDVIILYRSLSGNDEELERRVVEALRQHDLPHRPDDSSEGVLVVPMTWHPHIDPVSPDPDENEFDDEEFGEESKEDNSWFHELFDENMAEWGRMYLEKDGRFLEARLRARRLAIIEGAVGGAVTVEKSRVETFDALDRLEAIARERVEDGWARPEGTPDAEIPADGGLGV